MHLLVSTDDAARSCEVERHITDAHEPVQRSGERTNDGGERTNARCGRVLGDVGPSGSHLKEFGEMLTCPLQRCVFSVHQDTTTKDQRVWQPI